MTSARSQLRALSVTLLRGDAPPSRRRLPIDATVTIGPRPQDTFSLVEMDTSVSLVAPVDGHPHLVLAQRPLVLDEVVTLTPTRGVRVEITVVAQAPEPPFTAGRFRPALWAEDTAGLLVSFSVWTALAVWLVAIALNTPPEPIQTLTIPDRIVEIVLEPNRRDRADPSPPEARTPSRPPKTGDGAGLTWGRRQLESHSVLLRRLTEEGDPIAGLEGEELLEALERITLYSIDDVVDTTVGGPRAAREQMGDAIITLETGPTGVATVVAVASQAPEVERWLPEPLEVVTRRGPPSALIRDSVRNYQRQFRACYERRLRDKPDLQGRVLLELDIEGGRVVWTHVAEDTTEDAELARCMELRARGWRFPEAVSEKLSLPLSFSG